MEIPVKILRGLKRFQKHVYPKHRDLFQALALQQRPETLFITCADSRIDPCLLTQSKPGDLFICRVIGNVVPRYPKTVGGVSATIEYAVSVLGVADIIICGHTDCGVMRGVMNPEPLKSLLNVTAWLKHVGAARRVAANRDAQTTDDELLLRIAERNVVEQLQNLRSHPSVASRLEQGDLNLHGWVYHIADGTVTAYDKQQDRFLPVSESKAGKGMPQQADRKSKILVP